MQLFFPAERVKLVFTITRSLSLPSGELSLLAGYNAGYHTAFFFKLGQDPLTQH